MSFLESSHINISSDKWKIQCLASEILTRFKAFTKSRIPLLAKPCSNLASIQHLFLIIFSTVWGSLLLIHKFLHLVIFSFSENLKKLDIAFGFVYFFKPFFQLRRGFEMVSACLSLLLSVSVYLSPSLHQSIHHTVQLVNLLSSSVDLHIFS